MATCEIMESTISARGGSTRKRKNYHLETEYEPPLKRPRVRDSHSQICCVLSSNTGEELGDYSALTSSTGDGVSDALTENSDILNARESSSQSSRVSVVTCNYEQQSLRKAKARCRSKHRKKIVDTERCSRYDSESDLTCSVCSEIFHVPICILPCLHCFCGGCISKWISTRGTLRASCPLCRSPFDTVCRHKELQMDCESYLAKNPSRMRCSTEQTFLDESNLFVNEVHFMPKISSQNRETVINVYAINRAEAMEYASALVPMGILPSSIHYNSVDRDGNFTRRTL